MAPFYLLRSNGSPAPYSVAQFRAYYPTLQDDVKGHSESAVKLANNAVTLVRKRARLTTLFSDLATL